MHQRKKLLAAAAMLGILCVASSLSIVHAAGGVPQSIPTVNFTAPTNYAVGSLPFADAIADFNGDGILDIAVVNSNPYITPGTVSVMLGNGDGTFQPAVSYNVGNEPDAIVAVDLNGDNAPDIAVADELGLTMDVMINKADGSGTFNPAVSYTAGQAPRGIAAGDLRGIGKIDLVVANNLGNNVTVFLANGDGTFQPGVNYPADQHPKSVAIGNFNKDGNLDLATANGGASTVSILYGNGDGTFQPQIAYTANNSPRWLTVNDFNGDGFLDLATSDYDSSDVSVLLGTGTSAAGTAFLPPLHYLTQPYPTGLASGDFNNDGKPDLAVTIGGLPTAPNTLLAVLLNESAVVSPTTLTFPNQPLKTTSAPMTVTLTNTAPNSLAISSIALSGTQSVDFAQTNNCGTGLSGDASCTISVTFTPQAVNGLTATLTITDSAPGGTQTMGIKGTGTAAQFSPTSLTFASQAVGTTSAPQTVTMTNLSGNSTITISAVGFTGTNASDFAQTNTCNGSIAPKKSCTFSVTFDPAATGSASAALSITDNGGGSPQTVPLTGAGITPVVVAPTSLTYPVQVLKTTSAAQLVTITNNTTSAITFSSIAITGTDPGDFAQTNTCGTSLAASSSCTVSVTFTPTNINNRTATLTITTSGGTFTITLTGASTAAALVPTTLTFAAQTVGTASAAQTVTLTDASGTTALKITSITVTGANATDFTQTNNCGTSLVQKKSCTISITFDPTATGTRGASVSVADNGGASPQTVALTGTGQ